MNICVFSTHYGGGYGTGYSLRKEVEQFRKNGHKIYVIHHEKNISQYQDSGVDYYYFKISFLPLLNLWLLRREISGIIKSILNKNTIDLFYVNSLEFGTFIGKVAGNFPIIYFARSTIKGPGLCGESEYWLDHIKKIFIKRTLVWLEKNNLKKCDRIIVKSKLMKKELVSLYNISNSKIDIIPGAIDSIDFSLITEKEIARIKSALNVPRDKKILLFAGRITPIKGLQYLLEALVELIKDKQPVYLLIAGRVLRGHYDRVIERFISSNGLSNFVKFLGYTPQSKMYEIYNISDIVVFPSVYEPFGMVAIQAIATNKPLIVSRSVGALEYIKKYSPLEIVGPQSSTEIASAVKRIIEPQKKVSFNMINLSSMYWSNYVRKLENIFNATLNGKSIILVNYKDKQIGLGKKDQVHKVGLLHRAFSVFIFNNYGQLLLQRRSFNKYHTPGLWTNTCCSHPSSSDILLDAHNRLVKEMGFDCDLKEVFSFRYKAKLGKELFEHEIDHVLVGIYNKDPKPSSKEVDDYLWITREDLITDMKNNNQKYTPWFSVIINRYDKKIWSYQKA